jgi:hypothetical protein
MNNEQRKAIGAGLNIHQTLINDKGANKGVEAVED